VQARGLVSAFARSGPFGAVPLEGVYVFRAPGYLGECECLPEPHVPPSSSPPPPEADEDAVLIDLRNDEDFGRAVEFTTDKLEAEFGEHPRFARGGIEDVIRDVFQAFPGCSDFKPMPTRAVLEVAREAVENAIRESEDETWGGPAEPPAFAVAQRYGALRPRIAVRGHRTRRVRAGARRARSPGRLADDDPEPDRVALAGGAR
jgi:hypothetical protein